MVSTSRLTSLGKAIGSEFSDKNVTFLAGSIAYNAFVSLVPLLLFFILALTLLGPTWEARFLTLVTENVSPAIGNLIEQLLQSQASGAVGSSVVGFTVLIWGTLKIFRGLDTAFEEIYEVDGDVGIVDQLRDGVTVLVSIVIAVGAIIAATVVFSAFSRSVPFLGMFLPLVLAAGLVVAFLPMFYIFPNVDVTVREVLPGVLVAAIGWAILQGLFQIYVAVSTGGGGTDVITGIMLLLTWLYFSGVVLLLGVVVNAVLGGYTQRRPGPAAPTTD